MNESIEITGMILYGFIGGLITLIIIAWTDWDINDHYREGQIDALNGKIKYEKYETEIKEILWRKKSKHTIK